MKKKGRGTIGECGMKFGACTRKVQINAYQDRTTENYEHCLNQVKSLAVRPTSYA